jgi:hypothetical protein
MATTYNGNQNQPAIKEYAFEEIRSTTTAAAAA